MNRSWIAVAGITLARFLAAAASVFILLAPCWTKSAGDPGPAQPGPVEVVPPGAGAVSQPRQVAHQAPAPAQVQPGMRVERQVLSPSGKLRVQYMRDRQRGLRQIALQDPKNPANTTVLAQYQRNAWVVISPDDQWIVLNSRDGAGGGAQLYQRVSAAPLKYEVPPELRGNGGLQNVVWQNYLNETRQDPSTARGQVTIDGLAWEPDSHRVTLSVAPLATKNDAALPEPWTCSYDVMTKQIEPTAEVAEGPADAAPDEAAPASPEMTASEGVEADAPAEESTEYEGERFPATREEPITMADANELELSDLRYAINEMLARRGANFHDAKVKKTFAQFSWYQPRTSVSEEEIENEFTDLEKQNIAVLRRCRDAKIAAARRPERRAIRGEPVEEPDGERALRNFMQGVSDALNGNP